MAAPTTSVSHCKAHTVKSALRRPKTVGDVDAAMKEMDETYQTSFSDWIRSEANIGFVCTYKRQMFDRYMNEDAHTLSLVLCWMTQDWTVASIAEFMLKLFYSYKISSRRFTHLIAVVSAEWPAERKEEIVNVLLIGETPATTAQFIKHYTEGNYLRTRPHGDADDKMDEIPLKPWSNEDIVSLTTAVSKLLRWNDVFMMDFITEYAGLLFTDPIQKAKAVVTVLHEYENLSASATSIPDKSSHSTSRSQSEATLFDDDDSDASQTTSTSEDEEIQRRIAEIVRPKSGFRTMRESIAFGMRIFGQMLEQVDSEESNDFVAAEKELTLQALNIACVDKYASTVPTDIKSKGPNSIAEK